MAFHFNKGLKVRTLYALDHNVILFARQPEILLIMMIAGIPILFLVVLILRP